MKICKDIINFKFDIGIIQYHEEIYVYVCISIYVFEIKFHIENRQ